MNRKSFRFFVFFILIIFLTALIYFGIALYNKISANSKIMDDQFNSLTGKILLQSKNASLYPSPFDKNLEAELLANPYLSCIILADKNSVFFVWPYNSSDLIKKDDGQPDIITSSKILKVYTATIETPAYGEITVKAALTLIPRIDFYTICSRTFIIILAGTVFDFLLLIYLALFTQKNNKKEAEKNKEMEKTLDDIEEEINTIAGKKERPESKEEGTIATPPKEDSKEESMEETNDSSDPAGLFSDKTGFGWESYLEPRLDAELIRAASNEMDIALFIITIKDIENNISLKQAVCQILLKFFNYKDMVFEYGEDGFAGLLVNTDIDRAMAASESLYSDLKDVFSKNDVNPVFGIGLTTRSLRLMTGARLIKEASKASEKALEEKTLPIVAFRVNHEKTKQYLSEEAEKIH